jgi:hypothetical protein
MWYVLFIKIILEVIIGYTCSFDDSMRYKISTHWINLSNQVLYLLL